MMQMMNRTYFRMASAAVAALLVLASCSQEDELTDGRLPEGKYPLEIASVTMSATHSSLPWTRVAESDDGNSSKWNGNEKITVQLGDNQTTTYTVNSDGSLNRTGEQLYWAKRNDNVKAWYPESGTINLDSQSEGLAYALQATVDNASYETPVTLGFSHVGSQPSGTGGCFQESLME